MNYDAINQILDEEVTYFTGKLNPTEVYVEYQLADGVACFESIQSTTFKAFVNVRYCELAEETERPKVSSFVGLRQDSAIVHRKNPVSIQRRIAGNLTKGITYFLADSRWRYVCVTAEGWNVCNTSKKKFTKGPDDKAQVLPKRGGDFLSLILPKLNMDPDDRLLYAVYLVHGFCRDSSHFAAVISSSKGTGKSTLSKLTTLLVAPTLSGVTTQPNTEDDLKVALANNYVVAFDNLGSLSTAFSNTLCSAITGATTAKRKLYTNSDQIVLELHNLVLINGIGVVPYQSDLAQRSLYFELKPIPKSKRRTDAEIWEEFKEDRPYILGAIFDTLSKAMQILPTVKVESRYRMADAHVEMMAIAIALGIEQQEFQRILDKNVKKLERSYAENNPFVSFVVEYMQKHGKVEANASALHEDMYYSIVGDKRFFPQNATRLSRRLNEEREALLNEGYRFSSSKKSGKSYITIERVAQSQMTKKQKESAEARRRYLCDSASSDN